jgi:hypothetical protein
MQPVPVQKSTIWRGVEGGGRWGNKDAVVRRRCARCVVYASGSGLKGVLVGRYGMAGSVDKVSLPGDQNARSTFYFEISEGLSP